MIEYAVPLALLVKASLDDGTRQRISDFTLSLLWISLCVLAPAGIPAAAFSFAFLYFLNTSAFHFKREIFGWADILLLPPLYGFLWALGLPWLAAAAPGGMFFTIWRRKRPVALAPFCLLALILGILLKLFLLLR